MKKQWILRWCACMMSVSMVFAQGSKRDQERTGGWIPMNPVLYKSLLVTKPANQTPAMSAATRASISVPLSFSWKSNNNLNYVTGQRDQAICSSCWAFATTAALESHLIISFPQMFPPSASTSIPSLDLSEQKLLSCSSAPVNFGCYGGTLDAALFYKKTSPRMEQCYQYGEQSFFQKHNPNDPLGPVADIICDEGCAPVCFNVDYLYTLDIQNSADVKNSLYTDGPVILGYMLYDDFYTYWYSPYGTAPWTDGVYFHNSDPTNQQRGGHAILAYGYEENAYVCKNSWELTGGPFGNGTFKMKLNEPLEAVNFTVKQGECSGYTISLCKSSGPDIGAGNDLCENFDNVIKYKLNISTKYPLRVNRGTYFYLLKYVVNNQIVGQEFYKEPVPNGDYIKISSDNASPVVLNKKTCVRWNGAQAIDIESWIVDSEGVSSGHMTFRVTNASH